MPFFCGARAALLNPAPATSAAPAMSLVLSAASSQYLSRTWGSAPTDGKKATLTLWVKRASTGALMNMYDGGIWVPQPGIDEADIRFGSGDDLVSVLYDGSIVENIASSTTLTDTSGWHHLCYRWDTTDATANNRCRIELDGSEVSYGTQTTIAQNTSRHLADNGILSVIGRHEAGTDRYFDGKMAYFYFIDGQALTASNFITGTPGSPKTYSGTYGTNGFFLNFSGSNTNDQSGNGSNWTQNNSPTFSSDVPT